MAKKEYERYLTYPDHTFYNWAEAKTKSWTNERNSIFSTCKKHKKSIILYTDLRIILHCI